MKIWILEIGEPLPLETDVRLHRYGLFSKYLANNGVDVTWWTSSFSHAPKKHVVENDCEIMVDKVRMKFIRGPGYNRNISLARIRHNKHFAQRFRELAPLQDPPDLIIAPIPIIEAAHEAVTFAKARNIPVIVDIRDLWPQELVERAPKLLQPIAKLLLFRAFRKMRHLCQQASGIMGICESYQAYGLKFAGRKADRRDHIFYLGYANPQISDEKMANARQWCEDHGLATSKMNVCFFGTIGKFFDLQTVLSAARDLKDKADIQWILCGDGSSVEDLKTQAKDLQNVKFPGWVNGPQIQALMEKCDVGLAPYRRGAHMALPNKPFEYMSGRLAVLSSIQNELPNILAEHKCGLTYTPDSVEHLKSTVLAMYDSAEQTKSMGRHGHDLWKHNFTSDIVFANALSFLRQHQ